MDIARNTEEILASSGYKTPERLTLLFQGGSHLYGAYIEEVSDTDVYGVFIEPPIEKLGLPQFEQFEGENRIVTFDHFQYETTPNAPNGPKDVDVYLKGLGLWARQVAKGSPLIEFLWVHPERNDARRLRFKLKSPSEELCYRGSPQFQIWETFILPNKHLFLSESTLRSYLNIAKEHMLDVDDAVNGTSTPKFPVKSAYHALRFLYTGLELSRFGKIEFPCPEREVLVHVRTGGIGYRGWKVMADDMFKQLQSAIKTTDLPRYADNGAIGKVVSEAYLASWELEQDVRYEKLLHALE